MPDKPTIDDCVKHLQEIALVFTQKGSNVNSDYVLEGYNFTALRNWLALRAKLPKFVIGVYVMPKVLERLYDSEKYHTVKHTYVYEIFVFINRNWKIPDRNWNRQLQEIEEVLAQYERKRQGTTYEYQRRDSLEALLNRLPHTMDAFISHLDGMNFGPIVSDLLEEFRSTPLESV